MNKNVQIPEQCKTCLHKGTGCSSRLQLRIAWNTLKSDLARNLYLMPTEYDNSCECYVEEQQKEQNKENSKQ